MFSIHDLNPNVILFVGRPSDTRKGLGLLLEAVEVLTTLSELPSFSLWIVGGSPREVTLVSQMINRIRSLKVLRDTGRILLWGRVENLALSEFYSRACVTVVPSYREEFGIVAVEAMMCGCPVIASRTGGLQDIIREEETGILFEADDVLSLAASVCGYLRNPQQRSLHCVAARKRAVALFSRKETLALLTQAYQPANSPDSQIKHWYPQPFYQDRQLTPNRLSRLAASFNDKNITVKPVRLGRHPVFDVEASGIRFVAKFFTNRFSLQASLFSSHSSLSIERGGRLSFYRALYNKDNPVAPVTHYFEDSPEPLIVTEWAPQLNESASQEIDGVLLETILRCQKHKPLPDCEEVLHYLELLESFAKEPDNTNLDAFDLASARLNSRMTGGQMVLCRAHPQVELMRLRDRLNRRVWPLPEEFKIRSTQVIDLLLEAEEMVIEKPVLAHGDLKPEHLLLSSAGKLLMPDFEHSRYATGPLDLSLWLSSTGIRGRLDSSASEIYDRICKQFINWQDRYLCICWVVSEVIFFALQRFSTGERRELLVAQHFLSDIGLVLFNKGAIR